jgi:hypothetical protein
VAVFEAPIDTYETRGAIFSGGARVTNALSVGAVVLVSPPNYVSMLSDAAITFVDPTDAAITATTDYVEFDNLGLIAGKGGWYAGFTVTALGLDGSVIDVSTVPYVARPDGRAIFTTTLTGPGIHSLQFDLIPNPLGAALAPFDNLRFSDPVPVPEPSALALLGIGGLGLLTWAWPRRKAA